MLNVSPLLRCSSTISIAAAQDTVIYLTQWRCQYVTDKVLSVVIAC